MKNSLAKDLGLSEQPHSGASWLLANFGDLIACPCGGDLVAGATDDELVCSSCSQGFDYVNGIFSAKDSDEEANEESRLIHQEEKIRDQQASLYDAFFGFTMAGWLEGKWADRTIADLSPDVALDIGCGTGRMTEPLAEECKRVIGVDRSLLSLHNNRKKLEERGTSQRVLLMKADATALPLRAGMFDFAITTQMIQHLPSEELRRACADGIARALNPDATFLATFYEWRSGRTPWRKKEGMHRAGIYFYRFTPEDVRRLLGSGFELNSVQSCLGRLLLTKSVRKHG